MLEPTCKLPGRRASTGPQCWLGLTLAPPAQLYGANTPMLRPPPARRHGHAHSTQARQPRIGPAPVITPDRQPCRRPACGSSHRPLTTEGGSEALRGQAASQEGGPCRDEAALGESTRATSPGPAPFHSPSAGAAWSEASAPSSIFFSFSPCPGCRSVVPAGLTPPLRRHEAREVSNEIES